MRRKNTIDFGSRRLRSKVMVTKNRNCVSAGYNLHLENMTVHNDDFFTFYHLNLSLRKWILIDFQCNFYLLFYMHVFDETNNGIACSEHLSVCFCCCLSYIYLRYTWTFSRSSNLASMYNLGWFNDVYHI